MNARYKVYRPFLIVLLGLIVTLLGSGCGGSAMRGESAAAAPQSNNQAAYADSEMAPAPPAEPVSEESSLASTSMAVTQGAPSPKRSTAKGATLASNTVGGQDSKLAARGSPAPSSAKEVLNEGSDANSAAKGPRAPLLIYRADIVLAVFEVSKGLDAVEKIAKDAEGYLVTRRDDSIVVRVPAAGFENSLQAVLKLGDVQQRNLQVDDVTAEMNDLTTRLKNAEAMRARLEQLLGSAKTTEEALKVEEQLGRVTGEIESIKGKLRLMSELVSFSTITVTFRPVVSDKINSKFRLPFEWLNDLGLPKLLTL